MDGQTADAKPPRTARQTATMDGQTVDAQPPRTARLQTTSYPARGQSLALLSLRAGLVDTVGPEDKLWAGGKKSMSMQTTGVFVNVQLPSGPAWQFSRADKENSFSVGIFQEWRNFPDTYSTVYP